MRGVVRRYWKNIAAMGLSVILLLVSLYQLEIVYIALAEGWERFDFPFYIYSTSNLPLVRDFFYALNISAFILLWVSWWYWED
jgi:hypothetical protein